MDEDDLENDNAQEPEQVLSQEEFIGEEKPLEDGTQEINAGYISNFESKDTEKTNILDGAYSIFSISKNRIPAIGVDELATEIARLIYNLEENDRGKMVGIFGKWGRGKTFLMDQVWEKVKRMQEREKFRFFRVKFHAWMYQDTPALWAYLYDKIANAYYECEDKSIRPKWKLLRTFRLNIQAHGWWPLSFFGLYLLFLILWLFFIPSLKKIEGILALLSLTGVSIFAVAKILLFS